MAKSLQQKQVTVSALETGIKAAKGVVFANFQGLTVAKTEDLRKKCRAEGVGMLVAKKTLVKRVLADIGVTTVDAKQFQGGIATFTGSDEVAAAKIVSTFAKDNDIVAVFGGILEGAFIGVEQVKALARLPSKQQLLGQLVGTLNAPVSGFVNALAGNLRNIVGVLNNIKEAKVKA